ncbi:MAG: HNH endonuclease [Blautia sp.]|nr:HNH endonuclease [Blautia sp.]
MIKIEHVEAWGFEHAIRGMRNPMNSWEKSDSVFCDPSGCGWCDECCYAKFKYPDLDYCIGSNDLDLMRKLFAAGTEHRKFMRQIFVSLDVTAPLYWVSQLDTYKIGTTRNSCSFMHKGVSEPYTINDFSVHDGRVYEVLSPCERKQYEIKYPYETDEFRVFRCENGREYKVFRNGRVVAKSFEYTDTKGRHRTFEEKECKPSKTASGYFEVRIGGRSGRNWQIHRLVAFVWLNNPKNLNTVNHINGDKGNNSVENLEWCDLSENIKKGFEAGLFENGKSLHASYLKWKNGHTVIDPHVKVQLIADHTYRGMTCNQLAEKYGVTIRQANNMISSCGAENRELFELCYAWEKAIGTLNDLRQAYLETKDESLFQQIRCLLPCGYNQRFTLTMNYEVAATIIRRREGHKLDEWNEFVKALKELPYMAEIMGGEKE